MANTAATPIPKNRARFALDELVRATGGTLASRGAEEITGVCTDSRAVEPGNLYVALRGETHDGHRFVEQAIARGAAAVLVSQDVPNDARASVVRVADTQHALGELARAHRRRWGGRVIAITGSAGKTTTKELTFAALVASGARAARTEGNLNNLIGVPMTLLCLDEHTDCVVLEVGTSARGEIARLAQIAEPEAGVVTSVAAAHSAGLGSVEDIAAEKASLLWAIAEHGSVVCFGDQPVLLAQLSRVRAKTLLLFGESSNADVRLIGHKLSALQAGGYGMRCEVAVSGAPASLAFDMRLIGVGPALDAAAALAVVLAVRGAAALAPAAVGFAQLAPVAGRLAPRVGPRGSVILDDTYNANSASMAVSIAAACELAATRGGRALLVLGDMLELGALSQAEHTAVGRAALRAEVGMLVGVGAEMRAATEAAQSGASKQALSLIATHAADVERAAELILGQLAPNDVVLVKGSRGMRMERVVDALLAQTATPGAPAPSSPHASAQPGGAA